MTATETFNPFLAAFRLALWAGETASRRPAPAIAAALPSGLVRAVRLRCGRAPEPAPRPGAAPPPVVGPPPMWD